MAAVSTCITNVNIIGSMRLTYSRITFLDLPRFVLCVVMCIQTPSIEVFDPKRSSPCDVCPAV
jgi:hypothetical protein